MTGLMRSFSVWIPVGGRCTSELDEKNNIRKWLSRFIIDMGTYINERIVQEIFIYFKIALCE